jgi:protein-S-isoprenylcysteine O-methyltransferase Ste14
MARSAAATRALTVAAAVFLGFDGAVLAAVGAWARQFLLLVVGVCLFLSAGLVLYYWRWHQQQLAEIAEARRQLREEAQALRDLLQNN